MSATNDVPQELEKTKGPEKSRRVYHLVSGPGPAFLYLFADLFDHSDRRVKNYIQKGQVVADIGSGWGHFSFLLADMVGPDGKVYSVDILQKCINAVQKKAKKRGYLNIEARSASAAYMSFINDTSVDFVFANGLLCSMPTDRPLFLSELKRILKPSGFAYIHVGEPCRANYVDQTEWVQILEGFNVIEGDITKERWAIVSTKK